MEQLVNYTEAAALLGLKEPTLRKYTMLRQLPFRKIGTRVLFSPSELEAWANERRVPALGEENHKRRKAPASTGKANQ